MSAPRRPFASGRDADVHRQGATMVRRRYRDGRSARAEANILRAVGALGFPVPAVHESHGPEIIMDFVPGPTLAEALVDGMDPVAAGAVLADLHHKLHALDWPAAASGECLLHLDLHPQNVLLAQDRPVVIDWTNARLGPPGLDVATTALVLAQLVVTDDMPASLGLDDGARNTVREVLQAFGRRVDAPSDDELAAAVDRRRGDRFQTDAERATLRRAAQLAGTATRRGRDR